MSRTGSALLVLLAGLPLAARAEEAPAPAEAPPAPEEEPEGLPDAAPPVVRGGSTRAVPPVPRVVLGARLGAALPLTGLGPGVAPGLEGGVVIDDAGRFTVVLDLGFAGGEGSGTLEDGPGGVPFAWTLTTQSIEVAPALRVRLLPWAERMSPEVMAGPLLVAWDAVSAGSWGGAAVPETHESNVAAGGFVAGALAGRVGPGTLEGRVTFSLVHYDGTLTGRALVPTLTPAIGYRVER